MIPIVFSEVLQLGFCSADFIDSSLNACINGSQLIECLEIVLSLNPLILTEINLYIHINRALADKTSSDVIRNSLFKLLRVEKDSNVSSLSKVWYIRYV
jgi:hypothetical protein